MSGPHPAVAAQRSAVRRELADVDLGGLVLVACSGGQDSLALAAAVAFVAPRAGLRAGAVVVDHGLQAGSTDVAERAALQCRGLGLDPVVVVPVRVDPSGGGPEASARAARYAALDAVARERGATAVLLGHTLDDQAETVLLRLARGSGGRSLAGMAGRRGVLRRPFLGLRRAATGVACDVLGLEVWVDPTNTPPADGPDVDGTGQGGPGSSPLPSPSVTPLRTPRGTPLRSRVRHEVLPVLEAVLGPGVAEALARTADLLRDDADALDDLAHRLLVAATLDPGTAVPTCERSEGATASEEAAGVEDVVAVLDVDVLAAAPAAVRTRAVRAALLTSGSPAGSLLRVHVDAVDALLLDWHGQGAVALPGGVAALRRCGRLLVLRTVGAPAPAATPATS